MADEGAIASITTIRATTVTNIMMRLIMRSLLPVKVEARGSPAALRNGLSVKGCKAWRNFREHLTREVRRTPLLGTWVNNVVCCAEGS